MSAQYDEDGYDTDEDTDEVDSDEELSGELVLLFTADGGAQLEEDGELCWSSDDDDQFQEEFGTELLSSDDAQEILEYLMDEGYMGEVEAGQCHVEIEDGKGLGAFARAEEEIE